MFCSKLPEVMKMKAEFISKWGMEQLVKDANMAKQRKRPTITIRVRTIAP